MLRLLLFMVFVSLAAAPAAANDGCSESTSPGCGGCACETCVCGLDSFCCTTAWDYLCVDACQNSCGGCGGGGGDCGNISFQGCCLGQVVQYCEDDTLKQIDCSQAPSCGWNAAEGYYDCQTAGTSDPSGMYPMACGGGTNPICGNGVCEAGETAATCPQDCGGGCTPACVGKDCGDDGCGGSCGTCPEPGFCNWEGQCESLCTPDCEGPGGTTKECGPDGCGDICGECPDELVCGQSGLCEDPDDPEACMPDCTVAVCGGDGCGGICGTCPEGTYCNDTGLCELDEDPGGGPYASDCPPGQSLLYGKCISTGEELDEGGGEGCGTGTSAAPLWALLLLVPALRPRTLSPRR